MKSLLLSALVSIAALTGATQASAQTGYVYLGGALSLPHCQQIAGASGYQIATFGGFVNGIYIFNACFGSNLGGGGGGQPTGMIRKYDVYTAEYDTQKCAEDIEWIFANDDVRCEVQGVKIRCISRIGGVKNQIEQVDCVSDVYPLQ